MLELLEKRVRSRCGNVIPVHFCHPTPVVAAHALRTALTLPASSLAQPHDSSSGLSSRSAATASSATPSGNKRSGSSSSSGSGGSGNGKRRWGSSSSPLVEDAKSPQESPLSQGKHATTPAHPAPSSASPSSLDKHNNPVASRLVKWQLAWNKAWARVSASKEWESVVRRHMELGRSPASLTALASCAIDAIGSSNNDNNASESASSLSSGLGVSAAEKQNTGAISNDGVSNSSSGGGRHSSSSSGGSSGGGTGISAMMPGVSAWVEAAQRMSPSPPLERLLSGLGAAESALLLR